MTNERVRGAPDPRAGFTLVELIIVVVISTLALVAIYQSLITQERTYRYQSAAIEAQGTARMALQVVAAELREISASAGLDANMGGTDLLGATEDSITFRAFRKVGIVCSTSDQANGGLDAWVPGAQFVANDTILFYQANNTNSMDDDAWAEMVVSSVGSARDASCATRWNRYPVQNLRGLGSANVAQVQPGSLVRSYETATYGSYLYEGRWVLGRTLGGDFEPLVGPILSPDSGGLDFAYFDANNNQINPTTEALRSSVARVNITVRAVSRGTAIDGGDWIDSVSTNVYLRGN